MAKNTPGKTVETITHDEATRLNFLIGSNASGKSNFLYNWCITDSEWEAELCRVAAKHPQVRAYVKNYNLGFEVPYAWQGEQKTYLPDFILLVDDGHGDNDLLRLVVEIEGYRQEDAKVKKEAMEVFWVPCVNRLGSYGRWAFIELQEVFEIEPEFEVKVKAGFGNMVGGVMAHGI